MAATPRQSAPRAKIERKDRDGPRRGERDIRAIIPFPAVPSCRAPATPRPEESRQSWRPQCLPAPSDRAFGFARRESGRSTRPRPRPSGPCAILRFATAKRLNAVSRQKAVGRSSAARAAAPYRVGAPGLTVSSRLKLPPSMELAISDRTSGSRTLKTR
jgi:hypothetical protein